MKKKLVILIIFITLLCSCADYKELNTLSYITGIGFDYNNKIFTVTYEVMDNKKNGDGVITKSYIVTGSGKSTYEAHIDAASKLNKTAYFLHSQVIVLTTRVIDEKLVDVMDSIIRNPRLNEEFLLVSTKDYTPKEIFESTTDSWPCASFYIYDLIEDNEYSKDFYINMPFAIFTEKINTNNIDPLVSQISKDNEEIILEGSNLFNKDKITGFLNKEESNLYNTLINHDNQIALNIVFDNKNIEVAAKITTLNIVVEKKLITFDVSVSSEIKKSDENLNLFDDKSYKKLSDNINKEMEHRLNNLVLKLQKSSSDILGFSNNYYILHRKENNDAWTKAKLNYNIENVISRKGIVYNVG